MWWTAVCLVDGHCVYVVDGGLSGELLLGFRFNQLVVGLNFFKFEGKHGDNMWLLISVYY